MKLKVWGRKTLDATSPPDAVARTEELLRRLKYDLSNALRTALLVDGRWGVLDGEFRERARRIIMRRLRGLRKRGFEVKARTVRKTKARKVMDAIEGVDQVGTLEFEASLRQPAPAEFIQVTLMVREPSGGPS